MKFLKYFLLMTIILSLAAPVFAQGGELPPAPPFDSQCQVADEATVRPLDVMPEEPLRIAVLGLENNPFWIPVKE
ncbi:MAG: hypothetical protein JXN59_12520, partial [Anaerolineae bacterium]|nr:hypothetical protein [Anaerolineae bacterium]